MRLNEWSKKRVSEQRGIKSEMSDHHPITCSPAKSEVEVGDPAAPVRFFLRKQNLNAKQLVPFICRGICIEKANKRRKKFSLAGPG